jgi:hypothetical protein
MEVGITVAGTAPDFHGVPFSSLSISVLIGNQSGASIQIQDLRFKIHLKTT